MKQRSILSASVSLVLATTPVAASTTTSDLMVKGSISPGAACTVSIGNTLSLGTIRRDRLNADPTQPTTDLEEHRVTTAVNCPRARRFAFVVREAGGQDASEPLAFTMRGEASGTSPGKLFLLFDTQSTKIEGSQGYATAASGTTNLEQATWGPATSPRENLPITNGRYAVGFVTEAASTSAPGNIKDLSVVLLVRPWIKPLNELDLSAAVGFSSDLGLEINYF